MNPNERRVIANDLTHALRRGWQRHSSRTAHSPTGNPRGYHYSSARGFPTPESNPSSELVERYQYVSALTLADETLGVRDTTWMLLRSDYERVLSGQPAEAQAAWLEFLEDTRGLPFHRSGRRMRWAADKCPVIAKRFVLRLTLALTVEVMDPRDVSDEFAEEDEMRPSELFRALGLEARLAVPS